MKSLRFVVSLLFISCLQISNPSSADTPGKEAQSQEITFEEAYSQGEAFAKELQEQGKGAAGNFEELKEIEGYTESPKEAGLSLPDLNKDKVQEKAAGDEVGKLIIESHSERSKDFEDIDKEEWFSDSMKIIEGVDKGQQNGGVKNCNKGKEQEITEIEFDEKKKKIVRKETYLEKQYCEKSGSAKYQCDRTLSLKCKKTAECDNGGIVANSIQTDMKWEYNFPILNVGTIADNYWGGHCQIYDRSIKFDVTNIDKITEFRIKKVGFDDYLWIKLNGETIYVGPHAGDRVELKEKHWRTGVTTDGSNFHGCELNTNWERDVNIDLRPHIKEGENELWMRVLVSGWGEGWMQISAKQHCCDNWQETWDNSCEEELKNFE